MLRTLLRVIRAMRDRDPVCPLCGHHWQHDAVPSFHSTRDLGGLPSDGVTADWGGTAEQRQKAILETFPELRGARGPLGLRLSHTEVI